MTTAEFIDILEQRQLVSASIVRQLREKTGEGGRRITARSLLKYLVKKELLTRSQAKQLLETTLTVSPSAESSILGLIPLPEVPAEKSLKRPSKKPPQEEEIPTLVPVDASTKPSPSKEVRERTEREEELASISGIVSASLDTSAEEASTAPSELRGKKGKRKRGKENEFDSPLLLLGGGGLIVLVLAGVIIGYLLSREDADAILAEAAEYYDGGSYTQAINQYDRFVTNFPRHPEFSTANVRLGMAKIWKATGDAPPFSPALETTKQVLDEIEDEKEFESAKRDLSSRLPAIAQGLAEQAEQASDPEEIAQLVAESKEALALCNNTKFIPSTFRDDVVINEIMETLDRVERGQEQKAKLAEGLQNIQEAIDAQDTAQAYAIHKQLIEKNPGLLNDKSLAEKVREISAAEQGVVKFVAEDKAAETSPHPSNMVAELTLAERRGPAASVEGRVAVRVDGAVYVLNANDGKLLWRQFEGLAPNLSPVALPDGDLLVVDARHNDLQRLEASTGKLIWRQSFEGPILPPVIAGNRLLVTEQSGKLHVLETASGQCLGYVQFGQPLPVAPVVAPRGKRIYVVGDQSSIYTLGSEDYTCLGVFFLGQESGSIAVPPVTVLNKVVVAENSGLETSYLHVLALTDDDRIGSSDTSRRLDGLVTTPLLVEGRRLVALTTLGQVTVCEVGSGSGDDSLTQLATRDAESGPPIARFGLLHKGHVWSAGNQLNKLAVLPTGNRLPVRDIDHDYGGDIFDYPLQTVGSVLFHVRRPRRQAGAIVAAMETESGKALWETQLAVPLAGAPAVDPLGPRISAITASGAAYLLDRQAMAQRVQDEAERLSSTTTLPPLSESADLGRGRLALSSSGANFILHFRPEAPRNPLTAVRLPSPLSCPPVAWEGAFVAPTRVGQVYLYDGETAKQIGSPFQPPLAADGEYDWATPAVYGSGDSSQLVLSDGVAKIYLLRRADQPEQNLQAETEAKVGDSPLATRLAVAGETACAGTRGGELVRFSLPGLERQPPVELGAAVVWGPFGLGDRLLLTTAKDELLSVDTAGQIVWRQPLTHGQPCGQPLADGDGALVLWRQGGLSRIANDDGTESAHLQLEQSTAAGPVAFGNRLILASSNGTLLVVNRPD